MAGGSSRPAPRLSKAPRRVISLAISASVCEDEVSCGLRPPSGKRPANLPQRRGVPIGADYGGIDLRKHPWQNQVGNTAERALRQLRAVQYDSQPVSDGDKGRKEVLSKGWQKLQKSAKKARGVYELTQGVGSTAARMIGGSRWTGEEAAEIDASMVQKCTVATRAGKCVELNLNFKFLHQISGLDEYKDHLKTLDLSSNNIRRIENLDGMKRLRVLKLDSCQIKRIQHLDTCTSLMELHLQDNAIDAVEGLWTSRSLEYLNLNSNKILALGRGLDELVKLRELHLDRNQLVNLDGLGKLQALTTLCASSNQLSKVSCSQLRGTRNLDELQLSGNKLQDLSFLFDPVLKAPTLPQLMSLHLSGNLLKTSALISAPELPYVTDLDVSNNGIGQLPAALKSRWPAVEILDISANALAGPDGLKPLEELTSLRELTITGNPVASQAEEQSKQDASGHLASDDVVKNLLSCLPALQYLDGQKLDNLAARSALKNSQDSLATKSDSNAEELQGTFRFTETKLFQAFASDQDRAGQVDQVGRREQTGRVDQQTGSVLATRFAKGAALRLLQPRFADEKKVDQWQEQAMKSYAAIEAMVAKTVKQSEANLQEMTDFLENAERVLERERELQAKRPPKTSLNSLELGAEKVEELGSSCGALPPRTVGRASSEVHAKPATCKRGIALGGSETYSKEEHGSSVSSFSTRLHQRHQRQPRRLFADIEDFRDRAAAMAELDEEIAALQTEGPIAEVEEEIAHDEVQDEAVVPARLAEQQLHSMRAVRRHLAACQPSDKASRLQVPPPFPPLQEWRSDPQARKRVRACRVVESIQ